MKARLILLAVVLFIGSTVVMAKNNENNKNAETKALTTSLSGTITDKSTGESLVGVKVVLKELNQVAYTDFDGVFKFDSILKGTYTVTTDYVSYSDGKEIKVDAMKEKTIKIELSTDQ